MSDTRSPRRGAKQSNRRNMIGLILFFAQIVLSIILLYFLWQSNLIPSRYLFLVFFALVALIIIFRFLMGRGKHRVRFYVGAILSAATCVVLLVVTIFLSSVTGTLENITDSEVETANVGVYVLEDDPAQTIFDVATDSFGILSTLTREETDHAIVLIEQDTGYAVNAVEYDDLADLADGLLDGNCRSIILSEGFVNALTDLDGYEDFESEVRLLTSYVWDTDMVTEDEQPSVQEVMDLGTFVIYISGIDTEGAVNSRGNSDVNILAVVNTNTRQVLLVSTPRDYFVELSISNGEKDKLTHAGIYGIQVSMDTLEMLYGVDINYYFRVNFTGFEEVIDALGGVDVYSEHDFTVEPIAHYTVGVNHLSGIEALAFARERHSFAEGDRVRGENQMAVITGVLNALQSSAILNDFPALMSSLEDSIDSNLPYDLMTSLVKNQLRDPSSWNIVSYSVNGSDSTSTCYSLKQNVYVMIPDESTVEQAKEMIHEVLDGETVTLPE